MKNLKKKITAILISVFCLTSLTACTEEDINNAIDVGFDVYNSIKSYTEDSSSTEKSTSTVVLTTDINYDSIPLVSEYDGEHAWVTVNNNVPYFTEEEKETPIGYEFYSDLDELGRCGPAMAMCGTDLMPTETRESISSVTPTGWKNAQYDIVDNGGWVYNRCHLIAFQLAGENANEKNLITGTRYFNIDGMTEFENAVADYIHETDNHVLYRVTPIFEDDNLVADGVLMEGWSLEDEGESIEFCAFAFNVQPGITIDYTTGENWLTE